MIREGWGGLEADAEEVYRLLKQAAINGDPEAQFLVANGISNSLLIFIEKRPFKIIK